MMILWISTLYLISGPAYCSDVVGYSGGSVLIFSDLPWGLNNIRYVCKVERRGFTYIMKDQTNSNEVNAGKFKMSANANDEFLLLIRELNPQDSGVYRFGVGTERHKDVELTVQTDSCCGRIEKMNANLGETVTFTCNYPDELKTNHKYLTQLYGENRLKRIIKTEKDSQTEQEHSYSIFGDRTSKVFSVNISGVIEDNGGVYLCGVWKYQSVGYYSYFKEIQLQVTAPGSSVIITSTVCIGMALVLIGGSALITRYLKYKERQGSSSNTDHEDNEQVPLVICEYEEIKFTRDVSSWTEQDPTYTTVTFWKNPASLSDATVQYSNQ